MKNFLYMSGKEKAEKKINLSEETKEVIEQ